MPVHVDCNRSQLTVRAFCLHTLIAAAARAGQTKPKFCDEVALEAAPLSRSQGDGARSVMNRQDARCIGCPGSVERRRPE
jgi:hypothetical protein